MSNYSLPVILFSREEAWKAEVLVYLQKVKEAMEEKCYAFEYLVTVKMVEIWYLMISNLSEVEQKSSEHNLVKQQRMQAMLNFIHDNYQNPITITDISSTAHISVGECCRCFKQMIHTSPYEYLSNYRINQSIDLLNNTDYSITEISGMVGFGYTSQFIGQFKKRVLLTPAKYRMNRVK